MKKTWTLTLTFLLTIIGGMLSSFETLAHTGNHKHEKAQNTNQAQAFVALAATPKGPELIHVNAQDEVTLLYKVQPKDKLLQLSHHPEKPQILLAYAHHDLIQQGIYTLDYEPGVSNINGTLSPLLTDKDPKTWLFDPIYSPDGQNIYFVSAVREGDSERATQNLRLEKFSLAYKTTEVIATDVMFPSISEQGRYLTFIGHGPSLVLMDLKTKERRTYPFPQNNIELSFPLVLENQNAIFLMSKDASFTNLLPFFPSAMAHPGQKHQDYYGWQLPLSAKELMNANQIIQIEDIRDVSVTNDASQIGYLNDSGLHTYSPKSKTRHHRYKHRNLWKVAFPPK